MGTKIPWTEKTWNCICGCTKVSAGCENCYAERMSARLARMGQFKYGQVIKYKPHTPHFLNKWSGHILCDEKALDIPLHWKKPRMIFVNSMSDTFNKKVPFEFIDKMFFDVMCRCEQHTFQILTKHPERMREYFERIDAMDNEMGEAGWYIKPNPNIWLGTTCENQEWADKRIPTLLQIPAAVRFISAEPLLSDLDLREYIADCGCVDCQKHYFTDLDELILPENDNAKCPECGGEIVSFSGYTNEHQQFDQVIIGAESIGGHPGRECKIEWVRNIVRQCQAAGVAVFVKQIHMWQVTTLTGRKDLYETEDLAWKCCNFHRRQSVMYRKKTKRILVKDITKFPKDLQIREYPK